MASPYKKLVDFASGAGGSGSEDKDAKNSLDGVTEAYNDVRAPNLQPIHLEREGYAGDVTPQSIGAGADVNYNPVSAAQAEAARQGPSAYNGIVQNPDLEKNQMSQIGALNDLANKGGMNAQDHANLATIQQQSAQADKGRRDAIMQNAQERGMGGSGNALMAQLASSQAATQQQNQQGLGVAGMAQQRALDAMMQSGNLSGQVRNQDFGQQAQAAQANDAISHFNAQNATQNSQYNTSARNNVNEFNANNGLNTSMYNRNTNIGVNQYNANNDLHGQEFNKTGRQHVLANNTGIANTQETTNNLHIPQQSFQNDTTLAGHRQGAHQAGVDYWQKQSQGARGGAQDLMGGLMKYGPTAAKGISSMWGGGAAAGGASSTGLAGSGGVAGGGAAGEAWGGGDMAGTAGGAAGDAASSGAGDAVVEGAGDTMVAWHGGLIPGHAKVGGNSPANDTIKAKLSPGEVVLPRSVVNSSHPMAAIKAFMGDLHPADSPGVQSDRLGDFLAGMNPEKTMKRDQNFQSGTSSTKSGDADDIVAKIAALAKMSK